jgi:protein-tyrosine-phosphatase
MIYQQIKDYCRELEGEFGLISQDRKEILAKLAHGIRSSLDQHGRADLIYICTHNSRRSHFGQVWAHVGAAWYGVNGISSFSGGTEETAFHPNAIEALRRVGFQISKTDEVANPMYEVRFDDEDQPALCFSKRYDHEANPQSDFIAVMTCGEADENCPFIPGALYRIATTYLDPKAGDNGPEPGKLYDERCRQIGRETFYMLSLLK